jgi:drug/metabolite transporter (DMT)-like permease
MTKKYLTADFLLLLVAAVWGLTFTLIKNALVDIPPFTFNALRFLTAGLSLLLLVGKKIYLIDKKIIISGIIIGLLLFGGYTFQTIGLNYTSASNSGFITGLAVIFVPVMSAFIYKKIPSLSTSIGVMAALTGLYYLSIENSIQINLGDLLTVLCALFFALHVIAVEKYTKQHDTILLVTIQILTVAVISSLMAAAAEPVNFNLSFNVITALIICAIPATSLAFLIQNWAQKFTTATKTIIILSMEPVFSAVFACTILAEKMTLRDYTGAALMLTGILIAELKFSSRN